MKKEMYLDLRKMINRKVHGKLPPSFKPHTCTTWGDVWRKCEENTNKKHILVSRCLKAMTPYIEKECIVLDGCPIKYTQKRWDNLFKQYDLSKIPNFNWMKFIQAETHREQYIILVNHLDNL